MRLYYEIIEIEVYANERHPLVTSIVNHDFDMAIQILTLMFKRFRRKTKKRKRGIEPIKYNLNLVKDPSSGEELTFLHHLFANFSADD